MEAQMTKAKIVGPKDGKAGILGAVGVRFMIDGEESGGGFSLVEHPIPPRPWRPPPQAYPRGRIQLRARGAGWARCSATRWSTRSPATWCSSHATSGTLSGTPATTECRILEIISPAGFEKFFDALADMNEAGPPDPEKLVELAARYRLEFDLEATPGIAEEHGLIFPMLPE